VERSLAANQGVLKVLSYKRFRCAAAWSEQTSGNQGPLAVSLPQCPPPPPLEAQRGAPKFVAVHPRLERAFSFHPNLWRINSVSSRFRISATALCIRSSHVVEVAIIRKLLAENQQEQTILQDMLQDPFFSANAILDVPTVQYSSSGFST